MQFSKSICIIQGYHATEQYLLCCHCVNDNIWFFASMIGGSDCGAEVEWWSLCTKNNI